MGCCSHSKLKPQGNTPTTVNLPEINLSYDEPLDITEKKITIVLSEVKFTKIFDKITNFPCFGLMKVRSEIGECCLEIGDLWSYVQEISPVKMLSAQIQSNAEEVQIEFYSVVEGKEVEIGSGLLDLDAFDQSFKGIAPLYYRSLKSLFLSLEITIGPDPTEELILSFSSPSDSKSKTLFLPCRDYPLDMHKYFTPNFSDEKWHSQPDTTHFEILDIIKHPKTQYNDLIEYLMMSSPEYIYHTLDRLIYFSSQTIYASKIILEKHSRLKEILQIFSQDKLIVSKTLSVIFECAKSLENKPSELCPLIDSDLIMILLELQHTRKISSILLEVVLKYLMVVKDKNISLEISKSILFTCKNHVKKHRFSEIFSVVLQIIFTIIQNCPTKDHISMIFNDDTFEFIIESQKLFLYNYEIGLMSLKVLKLFLTHKKFKQAMIDSIGLTTLLLFSKYYSEIDIQKLLMSIIKELLSLNVKNEICKEIYEIVLEILKNNSDSVVVTESSINILKIIVPDISKLLVSDDSIDAYCMILLCMRGETELEILLLELFKDIKDVDLLAFEVLARNKKIQNCLGEIVENYDGNGAKEKQLFSYLDYIKICPLRRV